MPPEQSRLQEIEEQLRGLGLVPGPLSLDGWAIQALPRSTGQGLLDQAKETWGIRPKQFHILPVGIVTFSEIEPSQPQPVIPPDPTLQAVIAEESTTPEAAQLPGREGCVRIVCYCHDPTMSFDPPAMPYCDHCGCRPTDQAGADSLRQSELAPTDCNACGCQQECACCEDCFFCAVGACNCNWGP